MEKQTAAFKSKPLVTRAECAELLTDEGYPTTKGTLQKLASVGGGPEYQIFGNKALYRPAKAIEWAESRLSSPRLYAGQQA